MDFNNSYILVKTEIKGNKSAYKYTSRKTNIYTKLQPRSMNFTKMLRDSFIQKSTLFCL